ncbi:MAG: TRAP transporter small permease [Deltaproteobacteria bacterium]|nr:TRAP transporter small permease [Deltaproteobacteria bacterium]
MFFDILNKCIRVATIAILSVITVMVSVEVVLRYLFGTSLYITEEFTRYSLVWMVFLGSSFAIRENSHFRMEIFVDRFRGRTISGFNLAAQLLLGIFLVFLIVEGIVALSFQFEQIIPTLNISMFWFYLALPVGGALMILNLLPKIWENIQIVSGRREPPPNKAQGQEGGTS